MDEARLERIRLLKQELARRKALAAAPPPSAGHVDPAKQQRLEALKAELARRGVQPKEAPTEELSFLDRAMQIPRGMLKGYAADAEAMGPAGLSLYAPEYYGEARDQPENRNPEEAARLAGQVVDKIYGKNLEPTDSIGRTLEGTGDFLRPMPIPAAPAVAPGVKGALKYLTKLGTTAGGASAAINLTPQFAE